MEIPQMPLPMLEPAQSETGGGGGSSSFGALPFALPELGLGSSMRKRTGKRKAVVSMEDDDEDPREEAQMIQLLQQMQKVKQSKEKKRRRSEITGLAKANRVAAGVRKNAAKRIEEAKASQTQVATDLRSTMDTLRSALQEEAARTTKMAIEQREALKRATDIFNERYQHAVEVHKKAKLLQDCIRQHFSTVHVHIEQQFNVKISEVEGMVQDIYQQPDNMLSIIASGGAS